MWALRGEREGEGKARLGARWEESRIGWERRVWERRQVFPDLPNVPGATPVVKGLFAGGELLAPRWRQPEVSERVLSG